MGTVVGSWLRSTLGREAGSPACYRLHFIFMLPAWSIPNNWAHGPQLPHQNYAWGCLVRLNLKNPKVIAGSVWDWRANGYVKGESCVCVTHDRRHVVSQEGRDMRPIPRGKTFWNSQPSSHSLQILGSRPALIGEKEERIKHAIMSWSSLQQSPV